VNLEDQSSSLRELYQQAREHFLQDDHSRAASLYETLTEIYPASPLAYWHLGLVYLVSGQEEEAHLTWMMPLAEVADDPAQVEAWSLELLQVLKAEATRRETLHDYSIALLIRQSIRSIDPSDLNNVLQSLRLLLDLGRLSIQELIESGLIERLRSEPRPDVDPELLEVILQQLLEQFLEQPVVLEIVSESLRYLANPQSWIEIVLPKAVILGKLIRNNTLACRYGELCLSLDSHHSEVLLRLCSFYQDEGRYVEGIEMARRYLAGCQTIIQRVMGNALVLRGLMTAGAKWQEAELTLQAETALIEAFVTDYVTHAGDFLDASIMCTPMFFYPYFGDRPATVRPLQNQLSQLYQHNIQSFIAQNVDDYQPYPQAQGRRSSSRKALRIGYLSRCLRRHSVGWLSRWIFQHADRDRFEVYTYFNHQTRIDAFSQRWFADHSTQACCFQGDALGIAKAIQQDEIDILVDLDSITADYTCAVMALKPAPIQVTWLGLDACGLPAIDYFLADPYVLPQDAQHYYAEKIWRLPQTYIAVDGFEVGVPTLRRDRLGIPSDAIVYLSAQSAYKRHPETIRLQMRVLREVPNSYFLIKGSGDQGGLQTFFLQLAEEEGVAGDRLKFLPQEIYEESHRANLKLADVVLDTFPYNGATTTLETLWMGIPLVTRVGQQFAARNSYTMMVNAGITEGIAWTDEDYVEWGIRLGYDADLRQQISWKLWRSRQTAPLWNARKFTRDLEAAYTQMWETYQR
jgi:predicted O-linked N-acetylglucosamine transferase (SPINDLY family)